MHDLREVRLVADHEDPAVLARGVDGERVLLVGHNPDLPQIVYDVTGAYVAFKKSGIAAIDVEQRRLLMLLRPSELEAIARP